MPIQEYQPVSPKDTKSGIFLGELKHDEMPQRRGFGRVQYPSTEQQKVYSKLSKYQFPPASPSFSSTHDPVLYAPSTPTSPRRVTHRRSTPLSLSSNESIFSNMGHTSGESTAGPSRMSMDEMPEKSYFPPQLGSPLLTPKRPVEKVIDLDVVSQPLTPRMKLGFEEDYTAVLSSGKGGQEGEEEDDDEEEEDAECSLIDFLRESMSTRAMSVSEGYDPMSFCQTPLMDAKLKELGF